MKTIKPILDEKEANQLVSLVSRRRVNEEAVGDLRRFLRHGPLATPITCWLQWNGEKPVNIQGAHEAVADEFAAYKALAVKHYDHPGAIINYIHAMAATQARNYIRFERRDVCIMNRRHGQQRAEREPTEHPRKNDRGSPEDDGSKRGVVRHRVKLCNDNDRIARAASLRRILRAAVPPRFDDPADRLDEVGVKLPAGANPYMELKFSPLVAAKLSDLPQNVCDALLLHDVCDYTCKEASVTLGCSEVQLKRFLSMGRDYLRAALPRPRGTDAPPSELENANERKKVPMPVNLITVESTPECVALM